MGHAFIKTRMREENAAVGGELSGHYYFRENHFADSGLLAFLWVVNAVASGDAPLSRLVEPFARTARTPEINFRVEDKDRAIRAVLEAFPEGRVDRLDGVTVEAGEGWFNLRPSNTEPLLRLNLEASGAKERDRMLETIRGVLGPPVV